MRLWTIQPPCRLGHLDECESIHGDWERIKKDDDFWLRPYRWMTGEMAKRIPDFSGKAPIWAWPIKPDLRRYRWTWTEGWNVCIEFEAPDDRLLVSDFDLWHDVINNFPCSLSEAEFDEFHDRYDVRARALFDQFNEKQPDAHNAVEAEFHDEKVASWQRIFAPDDELERLCDEAWRGSGPREKQVCVDGLHRDWIRDVRVFFVRRPKDDW